MDWTRCPQCGQVAEVVDRDVWPSTDGPVEHLHVRCVQRHRFVLPASSLERHHADQGADAGATASRELVERRCETGTLVPVRVRHVWHRYDGR